MRIRITLACILGLGVTAAAQSAPATTTPPAAKTATTTPAQPNPAKADEAAGFPYHAEGRRDPFVSLLRRGSDSPLSVGARPPGLSGLGAGEVTLKGTMQGPEGYIGMLLGADNKTYIVRPGDRLLDGSIRAIAADSLVIAQQVNDPLTQQKLRDVRKVLRQTEEAK